MASAYCWLGVEWNVKLTTRESPHVIDKFQKTFETYWQSAEFERYDPAAPYERLARALKQSGMAKVGDVSIGFFDIKPYHYQQEVWKSWMWNALASAPLFSPAIVD